MYNAISLSTNVIMISAIGGIKTLTTLSLTLFANMAGQWEVSGKNFLITGGASGMGALHVENFVKEGAKVSFSQ